MEIAHWIKIGKGKIIRDNVALAALSSSAPEDLYRMFQYSYPKFFKMDMLCKWAWLGAEALLHQNERPVYDGMDKNKIAVVLATSHGCLDVDKKYQQSIQNIPSPALFVYTLSNIMLGEIFIRHGFKGEQACLVSEHFDSEELFFYVNDLLSNRDMDACICGWVNAINDQHDVSMFWVERNAKGLIFSPAVLQQLHNF